MKNSFLTGGNGGIPNAPQLFLRTLTLTLILTLPTSTSAILQTAGIQIHHSTDQTITMLASQGDFGPDIPMDPLLNPTLFPVEPPSDDPLLCNTYVGPPLDLSTPTDPPTVMLVPRGTCSFERKALSAQRLGASGILIYGALASRYSLNQTDGTTVYPAPKEDYDCDRAEAAIPVSALGFGNPPYDAGANDPVLSGTESNLCAQGDPVGFEASCPSRSCLLTGETASASSEFGGGGETMRACCAWDLPIFLHNDPTVHNATEYEEVRIPALYLTMEQALFLHDLNSQVGSPVTITMYERYRPKFNISSYLLWAVGVAVATTAAYLSASEIRTGRKELEARTAEDEHPSELEITEGAGNRTVRNRSRSPSATDPLRGDGYRPVDPSHAHGPPEETLELTMYHAVGFAFFSGTGLLVLYHFKIYSFVRVMYVFSCCNAMVVIVFQPFYGKVLRKMRVRDRVAFQTATCDVGIVTYAGLLAIVTSYGLGAVWIYLSFTVRHPDQIIFYWIMQDVMGACVCVTFLSMIRLNGLKVAAVLLVAAFFYDIFFVFLTPYITKEGKSIMIDVATSGGPPKASVEFCEKYPFDKDCRGGDLLPMLLTIPRFFDYSGGSSLLGLGDIVLPGLLLSFAARYDEAKRFVSAHRDGRGGRRGGTDGGTEMCSESKGGYFAPVCVAYAVGLMMANAAVYLMKMGQPALLYLVPCTLGTICFLGYRRKELDEMWKTPRVFTTSDELLYGRPEEDGGVSGVEGGEGQAVVHKGSGLT